MSLALHALTLAAYAPEGLTAVRGRASAQPSALHATLAPAGAGSFAGTPESPVTEPPSAADEGGNAPDSGRGPLANKWYAASDLDSRAEPLENVELDYPEALEGSGIVGRVRLLLFIDESGVVRKAQIASSQPERVFDEAAIRGWRDVRFAPARKNGVAVKSQKLIELDFTP